MKKIYLTSSLVNYIKMNGVRVPCVMDNTNCMVDILKSICNNGTNILLVASSPEDYDKNDEMKQIMEKSFKMSDVLYHNMIMLDSRNEDDIVSYLDCSQLVILLGGHLPTQNNWFNRINLKDKIDAYDGFIIGQSAGSMNCASNVYSCPEYEEDIENKRWIKGLGLTSINIFPHYNKYKDIYLGNLKMIDDIVIKDSYNNPVYALNDGSFIEINSNVIIYGECFKIYNGKISEICHNDEKIIIS